MTAEQIHQIIHELVPEPYASRVFVRLAPPRTDAENLAATPTKKPKTTPPAEPPPDPASPTTS